MRTRAYRPEAPCCLEDRSLLSGVAGHPVDPVVFSRRQFNLFAEHERIGFDLFARYRDVNQLHEEIEEVFVLIPFERVDGLKVSVDRIVDRMLHDLSAGVPHAIRSALKDVIAVTHADVQARVRAGDVVLR
jgi:hypothetical protein